MDFLFSICGTFLFAAIHMTNFKSQGYYVVTGVKASHNTEKCTSKPKLTVRLLAA